MPPELAVLHAAWIVSTRKLDAWVRCRIIRRNDFQEFGSLCFSVTQESGTDTWAELDFSAKITFH